MMSGPMSFHPSLPSSDVVSELFGSEVVFEVVVLVELAVELLVEMSVVAVVVVAVLDPEVVPLVAPAEIEGLEVPLVEAELVELDSEVCSSVALVPAVALVVIVELSESRSSHQNLKNFQVTEWECQAKYVHGFP
ncbi:unnamed protein product, partial [Mesorhabditis spiculigera]